MNRLLLNSTAIRALVFCSFAALLPLHAHASCSAPANSIEAENCLPGTPDTTWDLPNGDAGDSTIQGFTTNISANLGETVAFKVNSPSSRWHLDIYRMGYYGGNGARLITSVQPSVALPQKQPACLVDATTVLPSTPAAATTTGLTDCGNWAVSATWTVPASAVSGIYFAKAIRDDTGGASHIVFIVRNDASHSDILFQASDTSWQAYNPYSANFYGCTDPGNFNSACRAYKVSYNRPFKTRSFERETWVFGEEYPMVKWLEANGYDVTYFTDTDTDRKGSLVLNHKLWISNGHDEYWSGNQRASVEAARAAGVNLAFFSSNSVYWKTRWENSIDGSGTPYRTLVCFKETWANTMIDPVATAWTGTWRDPRFSPPKDGGRPENALVGTLTRIAGSTYGAMTVPQADGLMRFWRNTGVARQAVGQVYTLPPNILGAELMADEDNGFRPGGLFHLSTTSVTTPSQLLLDYGLTVSAGTMPHALTLYRHPSGALVFSAGTYDWAWGLTSDHDINSDPTDVNMQQATVNLFADMGVQPGNLQTGALSSDGIGGMAAATASTDTIAPTSVIVSPNAGGGGAVGTPVVVIGTATDAGGGVVAGVEVSTDGGNTWHPANGRASWTYAWTPTLAGPVTILSRAVDDSGNLETPAAGTSIAISGTSQWSIWPLSGGPGVFMTSVPGNQDAGPDASLELGLNFRADSNGYITGIRFFKSSANTGTHTGTLWTASGTQLATAIFTNETPSGWQQVNFSSPVAVTANAVYVASYHAAAGHYSGDNGYFIGNEVSNGPLHAPSSTTGINGLYAYSASTVFPTSSYFGSNYWVDVVFTTTGPPVPTLKSIAVAPAGSTILTGATQQFTATGTYSDGSTQDVTGQSTWLSSNAAVATTTATGLVAGVSPGNSTISAALNGVTGSTTLSVKTGPLAISTSSLPGGTQYVSYPSTTLGAGGGTPPYSWSIVAGALPTGLTLNSSGVLSGTPTVVGNFSITVQVADSSAPKLTATKALSLVVVVPSGSIWPATAVPAILDSGPDSAVELGVKFRSDVNGYINGIRFYKAVANTGVHIGNLWSSTGALLATATFSGETASGWQQVNFASPVAITANTVYIASYHSTIGHYSYSSGYFAAAGYDNPPLHALAEGVSGSNGVYTYGSAINFPSAGYNSGNYWVDVAFVATTPGPLSVATASLGGGTLNVAYPATTLAASGGTTPYAWSVTAGALPPGLSLSSSGAITGTPSAAGTFSFTVQVTDSSAPTKQTATASLSIVIAPSGVAISTTILPAAAVAAPYSAALSATGGTPPYGWSVTAGTLPAGLNLAGNGVISGTPTASGSFSFTVQASDSSSPTAQSASAPLSITVSGTALQISTTSVPGAVQNSAYTTALSVSGGTGPYAWGISAGALPAGLSLSGSTGIISGTPTATGTFSFTVRATDSSAPTAQTATAALSLVVKARLAVTTRTLAGAVVSNAYSATLAGSGGTTPYSWSISAGALPAGLSLGANGVISGTPTTAGSYSFTVRATDSSSPTAQTATATLSITVNAKLSVATTSLVSGTHGTAYSASLAASGGRSTYSWSVTGGALPAGLRLTGSSGVISGTPTTAGTYSFTVRVTDSSSPRQTATATLSITIL